MEVFKNEVGRPSNETLKKRKIIIGGGIALAVVFVFTLVFVGGNLLTTSPSGVTTSITGATSQSKLVIESRKVKKGSLFGRNIYGKEYYVDTTQTSNIDVDGMASRGKINWHMVTLLGDKPVGSGWVTFTPAVFSARYYCYTWDLDGNIVYSNSIYYWG